MDVIKGKTDRENYIMKLLSQNGSVKINDLATNLQVSRETIRRDLKILESKNLLSCTHGGATISTPINMQYQASIANVKYINEKEAIAKKASDYINNYEVIIIISSTTTERLAPYLAEKDYLTIITNSFTIAKYALQNPTNSVIILGGYFDNRLQATTGDETVECLSRYRADKVFFATRGISCIYGLTNYPESDTRVIRAALSTSKTSFLLSDYSKFWTIGLHKVCDASEIDIIISDSNLSHKKIEELTNEKIEVVIADYLE